MITNLTREPRSRDQIAAAVGIARDILGDAVLGAYLYGSAVAGGLQAFSDLDILVVSARSLSHRERTALVQRLLPISGSDAIDGPARSIELTILARPALVPWRYPPDIDFQYGDWLRAAFQSGDLPDWPHPDPDVAILVESVFHAAVPVFGPPVAALLERPPRSDVLRAMRDLVPVILPGIAEGDDIRNGVLTLGRIWMSLATGGIYPKHDAASWALARLPEAHRPVLAHAKAVYLGEACESWTGLSAQLQPYVRHVVGRIASTQILVEA